MVISVPKVILVLSADVRGEFFVKRLLEKKGYGFFLLSIIHFAKLK
jgi:hypothetical protein